jgi:hypothetical protein
VEYVACIGKGRSKYNVLVGTHKMSIYFGRSKYGSGSKWEDGIKIEVGEMTVNI